MAAGRRDVDRWIAQAKKDKMQFIISVCDTFDYDDYPVYCKDEKEAKKEYKKHDGINMQKINEVIKIDGNKVIENYRL